MATKRSNGEGTIYFNETKQMYQAMLTTPAGKRLTKASKNEAAAKDLLNEQRLLIGRGQHIEPHSVTFKEWAEEWLEVYVKPTVRPSSYENYLNGLMHTEPLYDVRLVSLTPSHIQKLYNSLKLSGNSKKQVHAYIRLMLNQAVTNKLLRDNPCGCVKPPKSDKKEIEAFTPDELKKLLEEAQKHRYPLIITLAYSTGMRISEILGLRWEDIDINKSILKVNKIVTYTTLTGVCLSEPKTKGSKRTIALLDETVKDIIEHKLRYGINKGLLFLTEKGEAICSGNYRNTYCVIKRKTGIYKCFHTFRHTHASMLLASGEPISDIAKRLGHTKISTNLDTYGHFIPREDPKEMVKRLSKILYPKS